MIIKKNALELARDNYKNYGKYVAMGRAYPNILDGCKSVAKRSVYGIYKDGGRSMQKLAKLAAYAIPYHPHPTSISGAIVQLGENGNKLKLLDTQGNWGDSSKNVKASAERYIDGKLSNLAIEMFCDSIEYCDYMKGEIDEDEPVALPALIPLCFINGVEGIPSGLSKINIPTLDIADMFDYYLEILKNKDVTFRPKKLPKPNLNIDIISSKQDWENILTTGEGSIRVAPRMELNGNTITITALPPSKDVESVRKIVNKEILQDKIDFIDESGKDLLIVIEKVKNKQCDMTALFDTLYKKLSCNISYKMSFFDENYIYVPLGFDKVVEANLKYIIKTHQNRISHQLGDLNKKLKILDIIQDMKTNNLVGNIFNLDHPQAIDWVRNRFSVDEDTANAVLQKPISYLTREHLNEIQKLKDDIAVLTNDKSDIYEFLAKKYKDMKTKVMKQVSKNTVKFIKAPK